jgi:transposase
MREQNSVYRRYDDAFRRDALALLERTGRCLKAVAEDLGVPHSTLHAWYTLDMAKKGKKGKTAPRSRAAPVSAALRQATETPEEKIARLEHELAALHRKNEELEMDRAILKKAAAFFAKESE